MSEDWIATPHRVVERLLVARWDFSKLETAEVIDFAGEPGVLLLWSQGGGARFGLAMSWSQLEANQIAQGSWPEDLWLAIEEPHEASHDGSRTWFTEFP